jgi:PAS domain S-box-containing protein
LKPALRHSLYYRITIGWLLPLSGALIILTVLHWRGVYRTYLDQARTRAEGLAVSWNTLRLTDGQTLEGYALELVRRHGLRRLWEVDYRYRILRSHLPAEQGRPIPDAYRGLVAQVLALRTPYWGFGPDGVLLYAYPVLGREFSDNPRDPVAVLILEQDRRHITGAFWKYVLGTLPVVAGIWLALVGLLLLFTHRRLVRPAERALGLVDALEAGHSVEPAAFPHPPQDELERLLARLGEVARAWSQRPEKEPLYRSWFGALPVPVCILDEELRILELNEAALSWLGTRGGSIRGSALPVLVPGLDFSSWKTLFESEEPRSGPVELWELPGGRRAHVLAIGRALLTEGRRCYLVVLVEVSEQKRLEHQLRAYAQHLEELLEQRTAELSEAQAFLHNLIDTAQVVIFAFDAEGRTQIWNRKAYEVTGYSRSEIPSLEAFLEKSAADPDAASELLSAFRPPEGHREFEMRLRNRTGSERILSWTVSRITGAGGSFVAVGIDITEARRLEAQLRTYTENLEQLVRTRTAELEAKNQQLAAINEELNDFTYIVSHDLQTPLRNILGFISLLEEDHLQELTPQARELLEFIKQAAHRMSRLITNLLELSRISRTEAPDMEVDLEELVRTLIREDFPQALARERPFEIEMLTPLPIVRGDPLRLRQVFHNLITNGLKYNRSPQPRVEIGASESENEYIVYVRDNGIGIDPKHHERIFKIFQRLHTEEEFEGTGAGLTICKKIIEQHGGRIWVASEPGKGSTFYFTLPKKQTMER